MYKKYIKELELQNTTLAGANLKVNNLAFEIPPTCDEKVSGFIVVTTNLIVFIIN